MSASSRKSNRPDIAPILCRLLPSFFLKSYDFFSDSPYGIGEVEYGRCEEYISGRAYLL